MKNKNIIRNKKLEIFILITVIFGIYFFLGTYLNPLSTLMFNFHDETQVGRIHDFTLNLKNEIIPPRIAPNFSFNLGMPVFNFYAPTAYWITSLINLIGFSIISSLKFSFLLSLILSFLSMFLLLRLFFSFYSSLTGGVLYVSSIYFAIEIFIRGNLAESWFLALFPLSLFFIILNSKKNKKIIFFLTSVSISLMITSHNILSLSSAIFILAIILVLPNKKRSFLSFFIGILLASYFLIPAFGELYLTRATTTAKQFNYQDHFLCIWQIWSSPWNFGGSMAGCTDDLMSFKLGKIHIVLGALGSLILIVKNFLLYIKGKKIEIISVLVLFLTIFSIFLTTYSSAFIWKIFEKLLSLFQFPWRFLVFGVFGLAFLSAYVLEILSKKIKIIASIFLISITLYSSSKYFTKPLMTEQEYIKGYLNQSYLNLAIAYNIREYLPKNIDYDYWHILNPLEVQAQPIKFDISIPIETKSNFEIVKNEKFEKKVNILNPGKVILNIHYFPYWRIFLNDKEFFPNKFDKLYRPIIEVESNSQIKIKYSQTPIQIFANLISIATLLGLITYLFKNPILSLLNKPTK